jgi:tRNA A37 threonylcarbamoyladenosine dehydratase
MKLEEEIINENNKVIPGSISFVPSAAGLIIASEVIKDLTGIRNDNKGA